MVRLSNFAKRYATSVLGYEMPTENNNITPLQVSASGPSSRPRPYSVPPRATQEERLRIVDELGIDDPDSGENRPRCSVCWEDVPVVRNTCMYREREKGLGVCSLTSFDRASSP